MPVFILCVEYRTAGGSWCRVDVSYKSADRNFKTGHQHVNVKRAYQLRDNNTGATYNNAPRVPDPRIKEEKRVLPPDFLEDRRTCGRLR